MKRNEYNSRTKRSNKLSNLIFGLLIFSLVVPPVVSS